MPSSPYVLGVDPGSANGALVLLQGDRVEAWWTYARMSRKGGDVYRVTHLLPTYGTNFVVQREPSSVWMVGELVHRMIVRDLGLAEWPGPVTLCLEGLFAPRRKKGRPISPQMIVPLAESAGELIGGLRMTPAWRPLATEWRHLILGLPAKAKARDAEAYAITVATQIFQWPEQGRAPTIAERGALAEAACIARYGVVQMQEARRAG